MTNPPTTSLPRAGRAARCAGLRGDLQRRAVIPHLVSLGFEAAVTVENIAAVIIRTPASFGLIGKGQIAG